MRKRLYLTCGLLMAGALAGSLVRAQTNAAVAGTSDNAPTLDLDRSEECIEQMKQLQQTVADLEAAATRSNLLVRAECIREKYTRIVGLIEFSQQSQSILRGPRSAENVELEEAQYSQILLACARAEKLAAEAETCSNAATKKPKRRREPERAEKKPTDSEAHKLARLALRKKPVVRDEQTCLRQHQMANMLVAVMDLRLDADKSPNANTVALTKLAIEPLDGWQPNECLTLDDFCVAVARALNLKVEKPDDPASYAQALRDEGLPVDTVLPARPPEGPSLLLLESEARAFFLAGYAAPLPTSRRLMPD